jgi:predicted phosphoribosyltransferase
MFRDRADAGRRLAEKLATYRHDAPVIIGLPRGGVPVAHAVARALHAPLDVIVVRKLGTPDNPELGFGAISEEDVVVFNQGVVRALGIDESDIDRAIARERLTLESRRAALRSRHEQIDLKDRVVIVIDDGIATGIDARAACRVVRARGAKEIVLAVPVAPADWTTTMTREADVLVAVEVDPEFMAVGSYYEDFTQVSDDDVEHCLDSACLTP